MEKIGEESRKHMCRFCNKSFPCGRSLGGHMRSHVINSTDHHHHEHHQHHHDQVKSKIGSSVLDKICKECGKGFQSWKALFGHMKCHSIKLLNNKNKKIASLNQDSWTSHSDNENSDSKDRSISRSRNIRNKRYVDTTGSSLISMNANCNQISSNNASTSMVSEIEQEQEAEVAMSLMMLSRDLGKCGNEFESSNYCYKSSVLLSLREIERKDSIRNRSKMNKFEETKVGFDFLGRSEVGFDFKNSNKRKFVHDQRFCGQKASHQLKRDSDSKIQNQNRIEHKPVLHHEVTFNGYDLKTSNDHQESSSFNLDAGSLKKKVVLRAHECPICFKTFTSGQALGGHKRSHMISEAKLNQENKTITIKKPVDRVRDTRVFLDLNMLPEEEEEEMNMSSSTTEYKSYCWDDSSDHHSHESRIMCLLSTS